MGMARYVVDAVLLEGRSAREVAAAHGIGKSWIYVLIERYRKGGYEALVEWHPFDGLFGLARQTQNGCHSTCYSATRARSRAGWPRPST